MMTVTGTLEEKQVWLFQQRPDMLEAAEMLLLAIAESQSYTHPGAVGVHTCIMPPYNGAISDSLSSSGSACSTPETQAQTQLGEIQRQMAGSVGHGEMIENLLAQFVDPRLTVSRQQAADTELDEGTSSGLGRVGFSTDCPGTTFGTIS